MRYLVNPTSSQLFIVNNQQPSKNPTVRCIITATFWWIFTHIFLLGNIQKNLDAAWLPMVPIPCWLTNHFPTLHCVHVCRRPSQETHFHPGQGVLDTKYQLGFLCGISPDFWRLLIYIFLYLGPHQQKQFKMDGLKWLFPKRKTYRKHLVHHPNW